MGTLVFEGINKEKVRSAVVTRVHSNLVSNTTWAVL